MRNNNNTEMTPTDKIFFLGILDMMESNFKKDISISYDRNASVTVKGGRPYKYTPWEIAEKGLAFFRECIKAGIPFSVGLLAIKLDVSRRQLLHWSEGRSDGKGNDNWEFRAVINSFKSIIAGYHEIMGDRARNSYFHMFILSRMGFGKL